MKLLIQFILTSIILVSLIGSVAAQDEGGKSHIRLETPVPGTWDMDPNFNPENEETTGSGVTFILPIGLGLGYHYLSHVATVDTYYGPSWISFDIQFRTGLVGLSYTFWSDIVTFGYLHPVWGEIRVKPRPENTSDIEKVEYALNVRGGGYFAGLGFTAGVFELFVNYVVLNLETQLTQNEIYGDYYHPMNGQGVNVGLGLAF